MAQRGVNCHLADGAREEEGKLNPAITWVGFSGRRGKTEQEESGVGTMLRHQLEIPHFRRDEGRNTPIPDQQVWREELLRLK